MAIFAITLLLLFHDALPLLMPPLIAIFDALPRHYADYCRTPAAAAAFAASPLRLIIAIALPC